MRKSLILSSIFTMAFVLNTQVLPANILPGQVRLADTSRAMVLSRTNRFLNLEIKEEKKQIKVKNLVI